MWHRRNFRDTSGMRTPTFKSGGYSTAAAGTGIRTDVLCV